MNIDIWNEFAIVIISADTVILVILEMRKLSLNKPTVFPCVCFISIRLQLLLMGKHRYQHQFNVYDKRSAQPSACIM